MIAVSISLPSADPLPWSDLARRVSANAFMNPTALRAAAVTGFADIRMLVAWNQSTNPPRLVGLWAMQIKTVLPFWPRLLDALPYNYAFLSSPVVDPAFAAEVIPAFLAAIKDDPALPNIVHLHAIESRSQSYDLIQRELASRGGVQRVLVEIDRPFATREAGVKKSGSTRKKLRQDWNRLSALGAVDVINEREPSAVARAFETFLALELASWKGARGTALLCDPTDAAFVRRLIADLAAEGSASVALLQINGRPVAAQVLIYAGSTAYTWKTAFDVEFARYSPGMLLVDRITEHLLATPDIEAIDSCSSEDGFMAQLWTGRRTVADVLINLDPSSSLAYQLEVARQLIYQRLRRSRSRTQTMLSQWRPHSSAHGNKSLK